MGRENGTDTKNGCKEATGHSISGPFTVQNVIYSAKRLALLSVFSLFCANLLVVCFDAKFNFDDSAKFRQQEVFAMDDQSESDPREVEAGKYALNYISLDGNIACLGKK